MEDKENLENQDTTLNEEETEKTSLNEENTEEVSDLKPSEENIEENTEVENNDTSLEDDAKEEIKDEPVSDNPNSNNSGEILIDNTLDTITPPTQPLDRSAKIKEPMDKKKKTVIVSIVVAAIIVIFSSIFFPTFFFYREKVMIASAEDFSETGSAKKYYVLKDDVTTKDLTLKTGYSIDLHKHNLDVEGTLTLAPSTKNTINIGTRKSGEFTSSGILYAKNLIIDSETASFNFISPLVVKETLTINNAKTITINNATITAGATIKADTVYLNGKIENSTKLNFECKTLYISGNVTSDTINVTGDTKVYINRRAKINNLTLGENVTAIITGSVDSIKGGNIVALEEGFNCSIFDGISKLAIYKAYNIENLQLTNCDNIAYLDTLESPIDIIVIEEAGTFKVDVAKVENATKYLFRIEGPGKDNFKEITQESTTWDITEFLKANNEATKYKISVKAIGNYSFEELSTLSGVKTLYLDSIKATSIEYAYTLQLDTPKNVSVYKNDAKVYLKFNKVDYADSYIVNIDGNKITINKPNGDPTIIEYDIASYVNTLGYHSIRIYAKSNATQLLDSKEAMTSYKKTEKLKTEDEDKFEAVCKANNGKYETTITLVEIENAKIYKIMIDGKEIRISNITKYVYVSDNDLTGSNISIIAEGYGFYEESDPINITIQIKE